MALDCTHNTTGLAFIETQEFFITYCITFVLCMVPVRVQIVDVLCKLLCFNIFNGIFRKILCIGNITLGLYRVAQEYRHSQAPKPKLHKEEREQDQQPLQSALPPKDKYLVETQDKADTGDRRRLLSTYIFNNRQTRTERNHPNKERAGIHNRHDSSKVKFSSAK